MRKIFIIAKKEFLDMLRDKRTLIRMILIPLIAFPVIINLVTTISASQAEKEAEKELVIGYDLNGQSSEMIDRMSQNELFSFVDYGDTSVIKEDIISKEINLGIFYSSTFDKDYQEGNQGTYKVFFRGANDEEYKRFRKLLIKEDSIFTSNRMESISKSYNFVNPLIRDLDDLSEKKEVFAKYAGGMLPYIFIAFLFMGCMLPAIDLFAGEKERGTIETLLTSPVNRLQIVIGKMIVVTSFGLLSATVALIGLFASLNILDIDPMLMALINDILSPQLILTLYLLLIPIAIFFAGIMIPISVYSRSFKEAQSILTPLNIVVVLPAVFGFIPGIELDYTTAFIPILNVVLATKAIIAGNADFVLLAITFVSLISLAAIAVFISIKQFGKESNILR